MKALLFALIFSCLPVLHAKESSSLPSDSIYHASMKWKDQNDKSISLVDLKGNPVIITMVYTGCAHACPMTIAKVQEVEQALIKKGMTNYKFILASFDTKKDTPTTLKTYMKSRKLDEKNWIFLSTTEESVARELAVILGISYKEIGNGDFSHSNVITNIDSNGVIKSKIESLNADISPLLIKSEDALQ